MTRNSTSVLFLLAIVFASNVAFAECDGTAASFDDPRTTLEISWDVATSSAACRDSVREFAEGLTVPKGTPVFYRLNNFNYLFFSPRATVTSTTLPVDDLDDIFELLRQAGISFDEDDPEPGFFSELADWYDLMDEAEAIVRASLPNLRKQTWVDDAAKAKIAQLAVEVEGLLARLDDQAEVVRREFDSLSAEVQAQAFSAFIAARDRNRATVVSLHSIVRAASLVESPPRHRIQDPDFDKGNRIVAVSLQAHQRSDQAAVEGLRGSLDFRYFVQSEFNLMFHVGFAASSVDDFEVETVRSLAGIDLFNLTENDEELDDAVVFLSSQVKGWGKQERFGLLFSLGTGLEDAGENLYLGASLKLWRRYFITAGVMSSESAMGVDPVTETIVDSLGLETERQLFETFVNERQYEGFIAVSIGFRFR